MARPLAYILLLTLCLPAVTVVAEDEAVFSGPQAGEPLPAFKTLGVFDDLAGQELDFVTEAADGPLLLIFVHELTRPSAAVTRVLSRYAAGRGEDGLACGVVWLTDDRTQAEDYLKRARASLDIMSPVGLSLDGSEGPGALGLNRQMKLTILVANQGAVTANFALIQPSVTDVPGILEEVVRLIGGTVPPLKELQPPPRGQRQ